MPQRVTIDNLVDLEGLNLSVTEGGPEKETDKSVELEASRIVATVPVTLYSLFVHNTGPAQYIMVFDTETLPANGAVTPYVFEIAADTSRTLDFNDDGGLPFSDGLVVCNSTTNATKTIGAADCLFVARFL